MSSAQLNLRQSQSLVMTQKLQQALKLLQSSNADLTEYLEQEVLENPFLEMDTPYNELYDSSSSLEDHYEDTPSPYTDDAFDTINQATQSEEYIDYNAHDYSEEPSLSPLQYEAPPAFENSNHLNNNTSFAEDSFSYLDTLSQTQTLLDHIHEQIQLTFDNIQEKFIAYTLADYLDECGWMTVPCQTIAQDLNVPLEKIDNILKRLKTFSPTGIFSASLKECLSLQLEEKKELSSGMITLLDNLPLLAQKEKSKLCKLCNVSEEELLKMVKKIRALNPKPAQEFDTPQTSEKIADILVTQLPNKSWKITLNPDTLPKVLINQEYSSIIPPKGEQKKYFKEKLSHAHWLVKNLQQRADTILKVGTAILEKQHEFFNVGIQALRPLTLKDIAQMIDMHESTVSRVSIGKYMETPHGVFELKFFFNAGLQSHFSSDNHSAESVRHRIKTLIDNEQPQKTISDNHIAKILSEEGINIARRTITKYRESMNIPSSSERRKLKKVF